jgi:hypothetical protein
MSKDYDKVKIYIHNYGPYLGEKLIIDTGEDDSISLDFQSIPQPIKDLQKINEKLEYYLTRDQIKDNMLEEMWKKRDRDPSNEREIEEEYMTKVRKFYDELK